MHWNMFVRSRNSLLNLFHNDEATPCPSHSPHTMKEGVNEEAELILTSPSRKLAPIFILIYLQCLSKRRLTVLGGRTKCESSRHPPLSSPLKCNWRPWGLGARLRVQKRGRCGLTYRPSYPVSIGGVHWVIASPISYSLFYSNQAGSVTAHVFAAVAD